MIPAAATYLQLRPGQFCTFFMLAWSADVSTTRQYRGIRFTMAQLDPGAWIAGEMLASTNATNAAPLGLCAIMPDLLEDKLARFR